MPRFADLVSCLPLAQGGPAEGAAQTGLASLLTSMFPFLMIAVLFYLLMIRPERRKRSELAEMLQNLKKNDRVVTIGGIFGTVLAASKDSDEVTIKVDENSNTKLRIQRSAIARVLTAESSSATKGVS